MTKRKALLVGSMPFENEEDAMTRALDLLGESLPYLPDGEIGQKSAAYPKGNRAAWVIQAVDGCIADTQNWKVIRQAVRGETGFPKSYDKTVRLRSKHSPRNVDKFLNFRYHEYFQSSYPIFQRLREERGLTRLKFQVGIPTGLGIAFCMFSPINAFRYSGGFNRRLAHEVNEIINEAGDDVLIQIEAPAEVALAYKLPQFMVNLALNSLIGLIQQIKPTAQIGIHFCSGDLNNKALTHADSLVNMVNLVNKMVQKWPQTHKLNYIHLPFAEADVPPTLNTNYYKPLRHMKLPRDVQIIAGFVHEKHTTDELRKVLGTIEYFCGDVVGVSCSCGLGRRDTEVATQLMKLTKELLET